MMIYDNKTKAVKSLDYREKAPKAAYRDMFLDKNLNVDKNKTRYSVFSAGVPGTVAGMLEAHKKFGKLPLKVLIEPAIKLARKLPMSFAMAQSLNRKKSYLSRSNDSIKTYYKADGSEWSIYDTLVQNELADVLQGISDSEGKSFYHGDTANKIVEFIQAKNGLMTKEDMASYKAIWRQPLTANFGDSTIYSMPPPSSGGIHIIQMLNILEGWDLKKHGSASSQAINYIAESMKRAYADRSVHLGDPDFYDVPVKTLTSKTYAADLHQQINTKSYTPSSEIRPGKLPVYESDQTTHYSVIDKDGNAVSNTYTLNASFGNARVAEGTGIIMNNEMDDFSSKPGSPNMFGLIGGVANAIEAGKRPLSSMSPTIIFKDGEVFMATGSPGGSRIITAVLQTIINVIDHQMNIAEATAAPRFHHQWYPDSLLMESGFDLDVINQLRKMGYSVDAPELQGNSYTPTGANIGMVQSIIRKNNELTGMSDDRRQGALTLGY